MTNYVGEVGGHLVLLRKRTLKVNAAGVPSARPILNTVFLLSTASLSCRLVAKMALIPLFWYRMAVTSKSPVKQLVILFILTHPLHWEVF